MNPLNPLQEKIIKIIEASGVSSTRFADHIDVSRPTISHILSGRNKPSIDVVQKIMANFPELGSNWILDGEVLEESALSKLAANQVLERDANRFANVSELNEKTLPERSSDKLKSQNSETERNLIPSGEGRSKIERIIIYYADGTMEVIKGGGQLIF